MQKENITQLTSGLHKDNSPINQPKGTYTYALNTVNETDLGDFSTISNEESNSPCATLPTGFTPIGKVYVGNNETLLFLVSDDNTVSEIGLLNDNCQYQTIVNDLTSLADDKINFKIEHPIDAIYRLRLGCERTVYFTDNYNRPRYFNFNDLNSYKALGKWSGRKFNLFKEYNLIPKFSSVKVLDSGGSLEPGSYNISIQYLDAGLNPTEWIKSSAGVKIYNTLSSEAYNKIRGSINSDVDYLNFPTTSKSIRVDIDNLDTSFPYYRLAFIEATSGNGLVSSVKYTDLISVKNDYFVYTGSNYSSIGTEEEVATFTQVINRAGSIEQIENRLLLANTQGKQVDFCNLQKYASRIKADCITKEVILNQIEDPRNPKNPTMEFGDFSTGGLGYMPGEIYSFGIVYVFKDGSLSPVFHIPGKNNTLGESTFTTGDNIFPMGINNTSKTSGYLENNTCNSTSYWGVDSEGKPLTNTYIRHHRFPLRSEIDKPLVKVKSEGSEQEFKYYQLKIKLNGAIELPCTQDMIDAGECDTLAVGAPFEFKVTYTVDGVVETYINTIDPSQVLNPVNEDYFTTLYTSGNIVVTKIEEGPDYTSYAEVIEGVESPKGLIYTASVETNTYKSQDKIHSSEILGIKFSGVSLPAEEELNGEKIIGYYIVRNERVDSEKTILDSAVLVPTVENEKYISTGLLQPELINPSKFNKNIFGIIHPEHKFNDKQFPTYDYIKQEGNFNITKRNKSKIRYNDVLVGTSFDSKKHKEGNDDGETPDKTPNSRGLDGWCLKIAARDNYTEFVTKTDFNISNVNIENTFYLDAVESRDIYEGAKTVYNISSDNKIGILQLKENIKIDPVVNNLPYVVMGRELSDNYSNFRTLPFFMDSLNMETSSTSTLFSGDSYVSPMRYTNTVFWENRLASRAGKKSVFSTIAGIALVIVGAVLVFFTAGASTLVIGAGIALIGAGALYASSGLKLDAVNKAYGEEYAKGLRETALDDWTNAEFKNPKSGNKNLDSPSDDEIQWIGDCLTDIWFDTTVNAHLRNGFVTSLPTFLDAPGMLESGNTSEEIYWEYFGRDYWKSTSRYAVSKLEYHLLNKLSAYDSSKNDNRNYLGAALGEYYNINPDYVRRNKQKIYFHLPLEYDCCSDCQEDFPHRVHYSEQSFQEELTDNYRTFLPNNYKDIDGETGEITNMFKLRNNLFIHTKEALYQLPRNYQERVTDQIVSFIGTGSYFEIPPQKLVDDDTGMSAGSQHKWSAIKTANGYFFVSANQKTVYKFDGQQLAPISNKGLNTWFKSNLELSVDKTYYNSTGDEYKYRDNVSNLFGTGYISTYDSNNERILFTKKDYVLNNISPNNDFEVCTNGSVLTIFEDFQQTLDAQKVQGWDYVGIEGCKLKFSKEILKTRTEIRTVTTRATIANDADVIVHLDMSGSFNAGSRSQIKVAVNAWYETYKVENPEWGGNLYYSQQDAYSSQRCWKILRFITDGLNLTDSTGTPVEASDISKNIVVVSFVNENMIGDFGRELCYHSPLVNPLQDGTQDYYDDEADFRALYNTLLAGGGSFYALNYPIVYPKLESTQGFLQHVLAVLKGIPYTSSQVDSLQVNPFMTEEKWQLLKTSLQGVNPYPDNGLENYGWTVKTNIGWSGTGDVITPEQFQLDMQEFLTGTTTVVVVETEVVIPYYETNYKYVEGNVVENPIKYNNGWTISYSLKNDSWTSWHSYLPSFYIHTSDKFYSWNRGNTIWKHGLKGSFQNFYGIQYPHTVEYVSIENPLVTTITNSIRLQTEASKYFVDSQEYFESRYVTFNKATLYNSRQCSGEMLLQVKDTAPNQQNYLGNQIINTNNNVSIIDKTERDWYINDFRDIRINYDKPIWKSNLESTALEYYTDKVLDTTTLNVNKDWTQLESFKDKYLVIRLKFDNFADIKLITYFSVENEQQSFI